MIYETKELELEDRIKKLETKLLEIEVVITDMRLQFRKLFNDKYGGF